MTFRRPLKNIEAKKTPRKSRGNSVASRAHNNRSDEIAFLEELRDEFAVEMCKTIAGAFIFLIDERIAQLRAVR